VAYAPPRQTSRPDGRSRSGDWERKLDAKHRDRGRGRCGRWTMPGTNRHARRGHPASRGPGLEEDNGRRVHGRGGAPQPAGWGRDSAVTIAVVRSARHGGRGPVGVRTMDVGGVRRLVSSGVRRHVVCAERFARHGRRGSDGQHRHDERRHEQPRAHIASMAPLPTRSKLRAGCDFRRVFLAGAPCEFAPLTASHRSNTAPLSSCAPCPF
jgi:hypothetical protein